MDPRAAQLVNSLNLQPHPEGGYFSEIFRSPHSVQPEDGRSTRSALTAIYFLLGEGQFSRWHKVLSDEIWTYCEGAPLELFRIDSAQTVHRSVLGPVGAATAPVAIIPAGEWQAARTLGAYTLVSCMVGPGFDFSDFQMAEPGTPGLAWLRTVEDLPLGLE